MDFQDIVKLQNLANRALQEKFHQIPIAHSKNDFFIPAFGIQNVNGKYRLVIHLANESERRYLELLDTSKYGDIEVKVVGKVYAQCLTPGLPISYESNSQTNGTLGCFVQLRGGTELFLLSNTHVLKDYSYRSLEANQDIFYGDTKIATLHTYNDLQEVRSHQWEDMINEAPGCQGIDAAIAKLNSDQITQQSFSRYRTEDYFRREIRKGYPVQKIGNRTGLTRGFVSDETPKVIHYKFYDREMLCGYSQLIAIECNDNQPFSRPGDSGSIVFDDEGYAIGLIVGGNAPRENQSDGKSSGGDASKNLTYVTYAHPFYQVADILDIEIAT